MSPSSPPNASSSGSPTGTSAGAKPRKRRWPRRVLWTLVALVVAGVVGFAIAYVLTPIPEPNEAAVAQSSILYYSDGKTELGRISDVNRESIPLADVPVDVQRAFLAAEDRSFYKNRGVSPVGIARALKAAVTGGPTQGGSTITQQYVKNFYLTQDQTVTRKLREIMISLKLDRQKSKDEILDAYLNTIYFGRGASGIQTAAHAYFGKDAKDLTASEGALLASVIRGPSYYDPRLGAQQKANAEARWTYVADGMAQEGWITQAQRDAMTFPTTIKAPVNRTMSGTNGYIVKEVKDELLDKLKLTDTEIDSQGLRIVTTIDKNKQADAVAAAKKLPSSPKNLHVGLASITPGNGAVVALYGGKDYQARPFDNATDATMQAGSTFKIFALIAALQNGVSTSQTYAGYSPQYFPQFADPGAATSFLQQGGVENFGNEQFGTIDLIDATAHSVNTVYAQVNIKATPEKTTAAAKDAGVTTPMKSVYANVFGTDDVKVIDMANAYATIAAGGVRATPYFVKSVKASVGGYSYTAKPEKTRVFDPDLISDVIEAQEAVTQRGTGAYAGGRISRPIAGKTGTTTNNYAAWFDGYTPNLATAVGIYRGDGSVKPENQMNNIPGVGQLTGGTVPVWIWTDYMENALDGMRVVQFPEPAHINGGSVTPPSSTQTSESSTSTTTSAPTTTTTTTSPTQTQTQSPTGTRTGPPTQTATRTRTARPTRTQHPGEAGKAPSPTTS